MIFKEQRIKGVFVIEPRRFGDSRGYFMESFRLDDFRRNVGDIEFVQDNE
ncbi:MAG: dTDP-4-dehydrorhamnose 3,5-epimerase family protein, partial [Muribaculaceae bacterium]|nr:dTDP-4-dehydrorhamnose 3,5-epimerase family protein [Muribaculaceae bacterium]